MKNHLLKTNFVLDWGARAKPEGKTSIETARKENRSFLLEHEAKNLLALHGAPRPKDTLAISMEEAVEAFERNKIFCSPPIE